MEDPFALGKLINYHRMSLEMSRKQFAAEVGSTISVVCTWEIGCSGSAVLPNESLLPVIATVLSVDLELLKKKYEVSKQGRIEEKAAKKAARNRPKTPKVADFSGEIGNRRILRVTNSQLTGIRFGRK